MPEASPHVVFRVDGGRRMGSGHVMRCLALAEELIRRGGRVEFVCRELPGHFIAPIERDGHAVVRLPPPAAVDGVDAPDAPLLGVPAAQDAEESRVALERLQPDWLVVDHYGIDAEWERAQRAAVRALCVIDDLANRAHECDVLVDQGYAPEAEHRYDRWVPAQCRQLLGPRYALLRSKYSELRNSRIRDDARARRVLVFFGGSDTTDETSKALRALSNPALSHLAVDVVLGANHPAPHAVEALVQSRPGTTLYRDIPSLAPLMSRADLAVGAGGTTTWERLALRLPSVVLTIAANQEPSTASLAEAGLVIWAGRAPSVSEGDIIEAIHRALARGPLERSLVDAYGAARVGAVLIRPLPERLQLKRATQADSELLFDWRNDPVTRAMSFDEKVVLWETHARWFGAKLADPDVEIFIAWVDGIPIGQARLDYRGEEAVLSYGVDTLVRGLGFGAAVVENVVRACGRVPTKGFRASVKTANVASIRVFERLGWQGAREGGDFTFRLKSATALKTGRGAAACGPERNRQTR